MIRKENGDGRGRTILCAAMKRQVVEEYKALFSECGLKLKGIDVAIDGLNRLAGFLPSFQNKNFILTVADGRSMMTSLYIDGVYTYTNRMRLVEERKTAACAEEMAQVVRSVVHFCRMQKEEFELDFICLSGFNKAELDLLIPVVFKDGEIPVNIPLPEEKITVRKGLDYSMDRFMYVTGNLLRDRKSFNFISAARHRADQGEEENHGKIAVLLLPAVIIGVFLGIAVRNEMAVRNMQKEIEVLEERLSENERVRDSESEKQLKARLEALNGWIAGQEALIKEAGKTPQMNSSVKQRIYEEAPEGMELSEPAYAEGEVKFEGKAPGYEEISSYARSLEESGLFSEVGYSGFTNRNPATGEIDGEYYFNLSCRLKTPD